MKIQTFIVVVLIFIFSGNISSQEKSEITRITSFVPQYLFQRGIRIDIEQKLSENQWIQFCPQIYYANGDYYNGDDDYNELFGVGIFVNHKRFVNNSVFNFSEKRKVEELGLYICYGLTYNYFYLNYVEKDYYSSNEYATYINKFGGDVYLGYQMIVGGILSVDIFTGLGTRYSMTRTEGEKKLLFNDFYTGYGYTGNLMHLGIKFGVEL